MKKHLQDSKLPRMTYEKLEVELSPWSDQDLLEALDSRSIKIGDTAASLLSRRKRYPEVREAVLSGRITTKLGKIRSTNVLCRLGKSWERAKEVYLHLIWDKNAEVAGNATFPLVFWQDKSVIPAIREAVECAPPGSRIRGRFLTAIEALEKQDPFIYSDGFHDMWDTWKLDPKRFADRIGPIP